MTRYSFEDGAAKARKEALQWTTKAEMTGQGQGGPAEPVTVGLTFVHLAAKTRCKAVRDIRKRRKVGQAGGTPVFGHSVSARFVYSS
eukprot:6202107-Pleurochrysis_carterae.AAC.4